MIHDRIDLGFAMLGYIMFALWSKKTPRPERFLPKWMQDQLRATRSDDAVVKAFEHLMTMENNADNLNSDGRRSIPN